MRLSIIIPVYNAERTLRRCLDSLIGQITDDVEILLINDGSTDGSEAICQEYAKKYDSVRCYSQENSGVSVARNAGINKAKGSYISFVDSDDYVNSEYIARICSSLSEWHPDMISFRFDRRENDKGSVEYFDTPKEIALKYQELSRQQKMCSCVSAVFSKTIIDAYGIRFDKRLRIAEDETFLFLNVIHADSLLVMHKGLYNIDTENQDSLSRQRIKKLSDQLILANQIMFDAVHKCDAREEVKRIYSGKVEWSFYRSAYSVCLDEFKNNTGFFYRIKEIKKICSDFNLVGIRPQSMKCRLIALPINMKLGIAVYLIMKIKTR